jgi:hypothetical protein
VSGKVTLRSRLLIMLGMIVISFLYLSQKTDYAVFAFGIAGIFSLLTISIAIDALIYSMTESYLCNHYAEGLVIHNILLILSHTDFPNDVQYSLDFKIKSTNRLEYAADEIENHLPKRLKTQNVKINAWFRMRCKEIAYALREKKKWILTPKPDTSEFFVRSLADFLIHFMQNEWDFLERMEVPQKSIKERIISQLWRILRVLVIGLLPIAILLWLQSEHLLTIDANEIGIAVVWAIVNLLWIDPSAKDKITAVKDLTGITQPKSS